MAAPTAEEALQTLDRELARGRELFAAAPSLEALAEAETAVLGRRAPFSQIQRSLGRLGEDDRRRVGLRTNEVREALRGSVAARRAELEAARERDLLDAERIDVTLPGRRPRPGSWAWPWRWPCRCSRFAAPSGACRWSWCSST